MRCKQFSKRCVAVRCGVGARANGRASGSVLTFGFMAVLNHRAASFQNCPAVGVILTRRDPHWFNLTVQTVLTERDGEIDMIQRVTKKRQRQKKKTKNKNLLEFFDV